MYSLLYVHLLILTLYILQVTGLKISFMKRLIKEDLTGWAI